MKSFAIFAIIVVASVAGAQEHASLAEQKTCATQAASVFDAWKSDPDPTWANNGIYQSQDYVNHYDPRSHTCYVMTHSITRYKGDLINEVYTLTDAFEKTEYASYIFSKDESDVRKISYVVTPRGSLQPKSDIEFLRAVRRLYGVH